MSDDKPKKITASELADLRKKFAPGTVVKLLKMNDFQAPPIGTIGYVRSVDDIGTLHVAWATHSSLGVVWGVDEVEIVDSDK